MPNEGDIRRTGGGFTLEIYLAGVWVPAADFGPQGNQLLHWLATLPQEQRIDEALARLTGQPEPPPQEAGREPPAEGEAKAPQPEKPKAEAPTGGENETSDLLSLLEGEEEESFKGWPTPEAAEPTRLAEEARTGKPHEVYYKGEKHAYFVRETPAVEEEPLAEPEYTTDAQGNTWVRTSRGGAWQRAPVQEQPTAPPGGWPGREQAPRQQSSEELIDSWLREALISGDNARALALDEYKKRPSSFQLLQFAQSIATSTEDFLKIFQVLQDYQAKSFEALGMGGRGFAGAVSPDQAARLVEQVGKGLAAAPPTVPGLPEVAEGEPPPPGGTWKMPTPGFAGTPEVFASPEEEALYRTDPEYRKFLDAWLAQEQAREREAKGGLFGKKPGEPGYEAQQAMGFAQRIGGQGIQALPETPEGKLGGFVVDISNLTPEQMQSRFGPLAGPTQSDIEDMTFEQLAASNLPDQQKEFWRKRKQARIAQQGAGQGFAQTVAGFMRPKPPLPAPRATVFTR